MKNFWRRCAVWAIRLRDNIRYRLAVSPRLQVLFLYWFFGLSVLVVVSVIVDVQIAILTEGIVGGHNLPAAVVTNIANDLVSAIGEVSLLVRFIIFSALIVISYFLSVLTLRPLQQSMQERKRFIANISHELRTPLSIMKAEIEAALLQGDMITKRELLEISRSNLEEVDRTAQII